MLRCGQNSIFKARDIMDSVAAIKVMVLHSEPFVAAGLVEMLRKQDDFILQSPPAGQPDWLTHSAADVVVADYEAALALLAIVQGPRGRHATSARLLILSGRETESEIRHAFACGAHGYHILGGKSDQLFDGVRSVHRGVRYVCAAAACRLADSMAGRGLTVRESDVLRLVTEGCCNKTVARRLAIAPDTVKTHMKAIFQKLEANNRTEAAAVAERRGLFKQPGARV
jgi:DNA-binding NarL/FixJ family response regulator